MTTIKVLISGINYGGEIRKEGSIVDVQDEEYVASLLEKGYAREVTEEELAELDAEAGDDTQKEVDYKKLNKEKLAEFALANGVTLDVEKTKAEMIADWEAHLKALATPPQA